MSVYPAGSGAGRGLAGLTGTGHLADDFYLLAHDDHTGKPFLQPRALGIGLASGLLGELLLPGHAQLHRGRVLAPAGTPPDDELGRAILGRIRGEAGELPAGDWLVFLGRTAAADVAGRLERAGYLNRARGGLLRRSGRWVPADADNAYAPLARILAAVRGRGPVTLQHVLLGGLAVACGLEHRLEANLPPGSLGRLGHLVQRLPPSLQGLVAETQAAHDGALLTHRI